MTPECIGLLGFFALLALLFLRVPVAVSMGVVGVVGMVSLLGIGAGLNLLRTAPWTSVASYDYAVIPLFMLMGNLCFHSGISEDLFRMLHRWVGHFRGGLALATVGACAGFAALSGTTLATAVTMGAVALPEMKKLKYDPALSTGVVAAGGTLGVLIPPSTVMVIYGILTEQNIAKLFMAGVIPGLLQALFYAVVVGIMCRINPALGPACAPFPLRERVRSLKGTWPVFALFLLVIGGIYKGWFSPSEAAAVGVSDGPRAWAVVHGCGQVHGHDHAGDDRGHAARILLLRDTDSVHAGLDRRGPPAQPHAGHDHSGIHVRPSRLRDDPHRHDRADHAHRVPAAHLSGL